MTHPARLEDEACVEAKTVPLGHVGVIQTPQELSKLNWAEIPARIEPQRILMCSPEYFDIIDVKNTFMEGQAGHLDKAKAMQQWQTLKQTFETLEHEVLVIPGAEGLEDMVFAANQVLPGQDADGNKYVVLSTMRHPSRQKEVPYFKTWFEQQGYRVIDLPATVESSESKQQAVWLEGQGDALWHSNKELLWGGYGHRSSLSAYESLAEVLQIPIIALALNHPSFYHLDTAFSVLAEETVMICPDAFAQDGLDLIRAAFSRVIEVSEAEAAQFFTCNALSLDNKTVILQQGANEANAKLRSAGFNVVEVDTSEFMKSGGSVFCLKMMVY